MRVSILLPLSDRQAIGWRALRSALDQDVARDRYEIVAIVDEAARRMAELEARELLTQCDAVIDFEGDAEGFENRVSLYLVGARRAQGELLFFTEGHVVLEPDCVRRIIEAFEHAPRAQAGFAPRATGSTTRLGRLLDSQEKPDTAPGFGFGGTSVVERTRFLDLAERFARHGGFGELALARALSRDPAPLAFDKALSVHFNDYPFRWLFDMTAYNGAFLARNLDDPVLQDYGLSPGRRRLLRLLSRRGIAHAAVAPFRAAGRLLLGLALATSGERRRLPLHIFKLGLRLCVVEGYCAASAQRAPAMPGH